MGVPPSYHRCSTVFDVFAVYRLSESKNDEANSPITE